MPPGQICSFAASLHPPPSASQSKWVSVLAKLLCWAVVIGLTVILLLAITPVEATQALKSAASQLRLPTKVQGLQQIALPRTLQPSAQHIPQVPPQTDHPALSGPAHTIISNAKHQPFLADQSSCTFSLVAQAAPMLFLAIVIPFLLLPSAMRRSRQPSQWVMASVEAPEEIAENSALTTSQPSQSAISPSPELLSAWAFGSTQTAFLSAALLLGLLSIAITPLPAVLPGLAQPFFLLCATLAVFVGSHRSLESRLSRTLQIDEAKFLPLGAALSLLLLYVILTFFPEFDFKTLINCYFALLGTIGVTTFLSPNLGFLACSVGLPGAAEKKYELQPLNALIKEENGAPSHFTFSQTNVIALAAAIAVVGADAAAGHLNPFLNNFIALSIACELLEAVTLDSFLTAVVISAGLLTYDYFAVFQSTWLANAISTAGGQAPQSQSMMVAVAVQIDGPLKLIFPSFQPQAAYPFSILGLGDIVVPALTTSLCLRVDKELQLQGKRTDPPGARPLFIASIVGYSVGLMLTVVGFNLTSSAQPALIYICPSIVLATAFCAWRRGELKELWTYRKPEDVEENKAQG